MNGESDQNRILSSPSTRDNEHEHNSLNTQDTVIPGIKSLAKTPEQNPSASIVHESNEILDSIYYKILNEEITLEANIFMKNLSANSSTSNIEKALEGELTSEDQKSDVIKPASEVDLIEQKARASPSTSREQQNKKDKGDSHEKQISVENKSVIMVEKVVSSESISLSQDQNSKTENLANLPEILKSQSKVVSESKDVTPEENKREMVNTNASDCITSEIITVNSEPELGSSKESLMANTDEEGDFDLQLSLADEDLDFGDIAEEKSFSTSPLKQSKKSKTSPKEVKVVQKDLRSKLREKRSLSHKPENITLVSKGSEMKSISKENSNNPITRNNESTSIDKQKRPNCENLAANQENCKKEQQKIALSGLRSDEQKEHDSSKEIVLLAQKNYPEIDSSSSKTEMNQDFIQSDDVSKGVLAKIEPTPTKILSNVVNDDFELQLNLGDHELDFEYEFDDNDDSDLKEESERSHDSEPTIENTRSAERNRQTSRDEERPSRETSSSSSTEKPIQDRTRSASTLSGKKTELTETPKLVKGTDQSSLTKRGLDSKQQALLHLSLERGKRTARPTLPSCEKLNEPEKTLDLAKSYKIPKKARDPNLEITRSPRRESRSERSTPKRSRSIRRSGDRRRSRSPLRTPKRGRERRDSSRQADRTPRSRSPTRQGRRRRSLSGSRHVSRRGDDGNATRDLSRQG